MVDFARGLSEMGIELLSTGGTASAIRDAGLEVTDVAEFTGQEEILGGRVKTLHPRLHAALLAKRDDPEHMATLEAEGIEPIDLVCVNLYPFQETVARPDVTEAEAVENIDIGGPTMIRAAAKNHHSIAVVVRPESYDAVLAELEASGGSRLRGDAALARERGVRRHRRLRRCDLALVRPALRGVPAVVGVRLREVPRPLLRREPAPEGRALCGDRGAVARAGAGVEAARPGALVQQRARPRRREQAAGRVRGAGGRDRQAQQPVRGGDRRRRGHCLRERAGVRPALRVRRGDRAQPPGRPRARRAAARQLHRGPGGARLRRGRARGSDPQGGDPDPPQHRARAVRSRASAT